VPYTDLAVGFDWDGMHYYDAVGQRLPDTYPFNLNQPRNARYTVAGRLLPGYHEVGQLPYFSRLGGFTWRSMLMLARDPQ
jgi:hypothetical protein